jgi:hypothetical protein
MGPLVHHRFTVITVPTRGLHQSSLQDQSQKKKDHTSSFQEATSHLNISTHQRQRHNSPEINKKGQNNQHTVNPLLQEPPPHMLL